MKEKIKQCWQKIKEYFRCHKVLARVIKATLIIVGLIIAFQLCVSIGTIILTNSLSRKMRVKVEIDNVDISWRKVSVNGITIHNLQGSILPYAFKADNITIKTPFHEYFGKHTVIDDIILDNVYLGLEFDSISGETGNWTRIMTNLRCASEKDEMKKHYGDHEVFIKNIYVNDVQAQVTYRDKDTIIDLPHIESMDFHDLSSEGEEVSYQIMNSVLGETLVSIFIRQNIGNMLKHGALNYLFFPFSLFMYSDKDAPQGEDKPIDENLCPLEPLEKQEKPKATPEKVQPVPEESKPAEEVQPAPQ